MSTVPSIGSNNTAAAANNPQEIGQGQLRRSPNMDFTAFFAQAANQRLGMRKSPPINFANHLTLAERKETHIRTLIGWILN